MAAQGKLSKASSAAHLVAYPVHLPFIWRVESRSRSALTHQVDLKAYGYHGECACEHFHYHLGPVVKAGTRRGDTTRCAHLIVARKAFADWALQALDRKLDEIEG